MEKFQVSLLVCLLSWATIFVVFWLMILRIIPINDLFTWAMVFVCFVLAFFASAVRAQSK